MNILFVISSLSNKAPVKLLLDIVKDIHRTEHNILLLTLNREYKNSLYCEFIKSGIKVLCLDSTKLECEIFTSKIRSRVEQIIIANQIDLLHCSCYNSVLVCSKIKEVQKSLTFHNFCTEDYILSKGAILGTYMSNRFLKSASSYNLPIAISETMKKFYQGKMCRKDISYIYNGIDTDRYVTVTEDEKKSIRMKLSLPLDVKIYIVSGLFIKRKDPITIVKAFQKADIKRAILLFIGDGYLLAKAKKIAPPNVIFKGFVSNSDDYLKAADCLISASHSEGLPLNVIEALSVGLPLILSDIAAHKEISVLGKEGQVNLFSLGDEDNLSEEIKLSENISYFDHCNQNRQIALNFFSKEVMLSKYRQIFFS